MKLRKLVKKITAGTMAMLIMAGGCYYEQLPVAFAETVDAGVVQGTKDPTKVSKTKAAPLLAEAPAESEIKSQTMVTTETPDTTEAPVTTETEIPDRSTAVAFSQMESLLIGFDSNQFQYEEKKSSNAEFTITAGEDIIDGSGTKLYANGDLVQVLNSNTTGSVSTSLPDGKYEVITTAGNGMKSESGSFEISYDKDSQKTIFTVNGQQQSICTVDFSSGRNTAVTDESNAKGAKVNVTDAKSGEGINGAAYTLYTADNIYSSNGTQIVSAMDALMTASTGETGTLTFPIDLPEQSVKNTGHYILQSESVPDGYYTNNSAVDFYLLSDGTNKTVQLTSKQSLTQTKVNIVLNNETDQALAGAMFAVKDNSGNVVDSWISTDEIYNIRGLELTGDGLIHNDGSPMEGANVYTITQTTAASGYAESKKSIKFFITEEKIPGDLNTAVVHFTESEDTILDGQTLKAQGSYSDASGYDPNTKEAKNAVTWGVYDEILYVFVSDTATQADADKFMTSSFFKLSNGTDFSKVYVLENGKNLDHFYKDIRVTSLPSNMHVSSDYSEIIVQDNQADYWQTMKAEDGTLMINTEKTKTAIHMIDVNTGVAIIGADVQIKNEAGGIVDVFTTDGKNHSISGLETGKYTIHVTSVPEAKGYVLPEDLIFTVDATTTVQIVPVAVNHTTVKFLVLDESSNAPVSGAQMQLSDADGTVIKTWKSNSDAVKFEYIAPGTYSIKEIKAANEKGYVTGNAPISISVKATYAEQSYTTADKHTTVSIDKLDKLDHIALGGATMELYNSNHALVDKWATGTAAHEISYLPVGTYVLKETAAPAGYAVSDAQGIEIKDTSETQAFTSVSAAYPVSFLNQSSDGKIVVGTKMVITDSNGTIVDSWTSKEAAHTVSNLKVSTDGKVTYKLTMKKAANGYTTSKDVEFYVTGKNKETSIVIKGGDTFKDTASNTYIMTENPTKVRFYKKDVITGKYLKDSELAVYNKAGKKIESWTSADTYHQIEKLPVGSYTLREIFAPKGYSTSDEVAFTVTDTFNKQKVVMNTRPRKSKIKLRLLNAADEAALEGAVFTVFKNGAAVGTMNTDKDGYATSESLPIGYFSGDDTFKGYIQYTVIETSAPEGYFLSGEEHAVTIKKGGTTFDLGNISSIKKGKTGSATAVKGTGSSAKAKNTSARTGGSSVKNASNTTAPQTGDNTNVSFYVTMMLAGIVVIAAACKRKKRLK